MKPIHKYNGSLGATLCHKCRVIITRGLTNHLFCDKCLQTCENQGIKRIGESCSLNNNCKFPNCIKKN
jgi:hypothetical protein